MKNKLLIFTISILIIISSLILFITGDKDILKQSYGLKENKDIAVMLWDDNSNSYQSQNSVPVGKYMLSKDSYCENGSRIISYDKENGIINYSMSSGDKCYVYFDPMRNLAEYIRSQDYAYQENPQYKVSSQDGSNYILNNDRTIYENVRYEGKDPDNYVLFNGELWRIIGAFIGTEVGMDSSKYFTKLVKEESIGSYAWDEYQSGAYENDWVNSTLNTYLNGEYYNNMSDAAKALMIKANWFLGAVDASIQDSIMTRDWYSNERSGTGGLTGSAAIKITQFVGLVYPSDIGYSAFLSDEGAPLYNNSNLANSYFAHFNEFVTITPAIGSDSAFNFRTNGSNYIVSSLVEAGGAVYPSVYLQSEVYITGGNGSKAAPYELASEGAQNLSDAIMKKSGSTSSFTKYNSSQDGSIYRIVNQNGHRFEGKNPDNYVTFNGNEEWRIIGTFDGSTLGKTSGTYYPKIVRGSKLASTYAWNSTSSNTWAQSSLYAYLQGTYYTTINSSDRDKIIGAKWYLGGYSSSYSSQNTSGLYSMERGSKGAAGTTSNLTTTANVGLIYPSDYGYAAYGTSCLNETNSSTTRPYNYEQGCASVDWLFSTGGSSSMWFITPNQTNATSAVATQSSGWVTNGQAVTGAKNILPTVYLSNEVKIIGGNGSKSYPYILSL